MALRGVLPPGARLSVAELRAEHRDLGVMAYFDGHAQAQNGGKPWHAFARLLTASEARCWREGWRDGWLEARCHAVHGFTPCPTPGVLHPAP